MQDPIEALMEDHRLIEQVLGALEAASDQHLPSAFYETTLAFLGRFADDHHHAKEEAILFPLLERRGLPAEEGPTSVMREEHELGRTLLRKMADALGADDRDALHRHVREYVALLRDHIRKEDEILFQVADMVLTPQDKALLAEGFSAVPVPDRDYECVRTHVHEIRTWSGAPA